MSDFDRVKMYYDYGWATKEQVAMYVEFGVITPEDYQVITGEAYIG